MESPVAATRQQRDALFEDDPVHQSMVFASNTEAYFRAVALCANVVQRESPHELFLKFEEYNMWAAAQKLADYWTVRLQVFGPELAFLPLPLALQPEDWKLLLAGTTVLLPPSANGGFSIIYVDRCKMELHYSFSLQALTRSFFFLHHMMQFQSNEKIFLIRLDPRVFGRPNISPMDRQTAPTYQAISQSLCLNMAPRGFHMLLLNNDDDHARRPMSLLFSFFAQRSLNLAGWLFKRGAGNIKLHLSTPELLKNNDLEPLNLPSDIGGEWQMRIEWPKWIRQQFTADFACGAPANGIPRLMPAVSAKTIVGEDDPSSLQYLDKQQQQQVFSSNDEEQQLLLNRNFSPLFLAAADNDDECALSYDEEVTATGVKGLFDEAQPTKNTTSSNGCRKDNDCEQLLLDEVPRSSGYGSTDNGEQQLLREDEVPPPPSTKQDDDQTTSSAFGSWYAYGAAASVKTLTSACDGGGVTESCCNSSAAPSSDETTTTILLPRTEARLAAALKNVIKRSKKKKKRTAHRSGPRQGKHHMIGNHQQHEAARTQVGPPPDTDSGKPQIFVDGVVNSEFCQLVERNVETIMEERRRKRAEIALRRARAKKAAAAVTRKK